MPGSTGPASVGPQGTVLKGWALIDGATGNAIAVNGALSAPSKIGTGLYSVTVSAGALAAVGNAVVVVRPMGANSNWTGNGYAATTTSIRAHTGLAGVATDPVNLHVELWG